MPFTVRDVMTPYRREGDHEQTLMDMARRMARTRQSGIPIAGADGEVIGIVTPMDIVVSLGQGDDPLTTPAKQIATGSEVLEADLTLEDAKEFLRSRSGMAAVVDKGSLVGFIQSWEIDRFLKALQALGPGAARLITEISPKDRASQHRGAHLMAAVSAVDCIRSSMAVVGKDSIESLLDFPSGYGRILRALKVAFPEARLTAGDIVGDAVEFCARVFDATPVYSVANPEDVRIDNQFELIWSGSLLTHINSDRWPGFLTLFRDSLSTGGLLVFTTHGHRLRAEPILRGFQLNDDQVGEILRGYDSEGFGYADYSNQTDYGISLTSPDWVRQQLGAVGLRVVNHLEQGWFAPGLRHDMFACIRE